MKYLSFIFCFVFLVSCQADVNESLEVKNQLTEIESYLEREKLTRQYDLASSGFYYKIIKQGDGTAARGSQIIYSRLSMVDFRTRKVYYNNFSNGDLLPINVAHSISAIASMINFINSKSDAPNSVAGKIEAIVPSNLAYSINGSSLVPPNTPLILTLEVENIYNVTEQRTKDLAVLQALVKQARYKNFTFSSPVYYKISQLGTGRNISSTMTLNMKYRYADANHPNVWLFEQSTLSPVSLGNLPKDLINSLSLLRVNESKAQFLLPSTSAFGIFGNDYTKPNTNLYFEIEIGKN